jgi:signal transduction histidine kinase
MESDSLSSQIKQLIEQLKVYVNLRLDYVRLYVADFLIRFFSGMVLWLVIFLFLFFVLVFGSFAFAFWFGELTGNMALGFLIIAGFYVLLAVLIYLLRKQLLIKPFTKLIMTQMELDKLNETEDGKKE